MARIIKASRNLPTYDEVFANRAGNSIRVMIDVMNYAKNGRLITGLPDHLCRIACRCLTLHVAA